MINAIIIDNDICSSKQLIQAVSCLFPEIRLTHRKFIPNEAVTFFQNLKVELIIINPKGIKDEQIEIIKKEGHNKVFICIAKTREFAEVATYWHSVAYFIKPILEAQLSKGILSALHVIEEKRKNRLITDLFQKEKEDDKLIGVPTIEGYQIFKVREIIRCEGVQKCTKVFTTHKKSITSSYNIGNFKKLLEAYDSFLSTHRSHIINMSFVKQYKNSGHVVLTDNSSVPITKQNKGEFLRRIDYLLKRK